MSHKLPDRAKQKLVKILNRIENSIFDEDDISEMLRYIRPFSKQHPIIWEFACFIAHTEERSIGVFKAKMDFVYSNLLFANFSAISISKQLNIFEIEENIFKSVILNNLKTIDEKYIIEGSGFIRKQAIKFITESYVKNKKNYVLKANINILNNVQKIIQSIFGLIDTTEIIDNDETIKQLTQTLLIVAPLLESKFSIKHIIEKNKDDIILCLMCLLHSHEFQLFDNSIANCELILLSDNTDKKLFLSLQAKVHLEKIAITWSTMSLKNSIYEYLQIDERYTLDSQKSYKLTAFNAVRDHVGQLRIKSLF